MSRYLLFVAHSYSFEILRPLHRIVQLPPADIYAVIALLFALEFASGEFQIVPDTEMREEARRVKDTAGATPFRWEKETVALPDHIVDEDVARRALESGHAPDQAGLAAPRRPEHRRDAVFGHFEVR